MKRTGLIIALAIMLLWFSSCFAQEERAVGERPGIPPVYPTHTIIEAIYDGAIEEESAQIQTKYKIRVLRDTRVSVPILFKDVAITKADLPKDALLVVYGEWYRLLLPGKGDYNVTIGFASKISKQEDKNIFAFKSTDAAVSKLTLLIPGIGLDVEVEPPISIQTKELRNKDTQLTAFLGTTKEIQVKWSAKPAALVTAKPMFLSENNMLVVISPGIIRTTSILNYKIMQGKLSKFTVSLPKDVNLLSVKGEVLKTWDLSQNKAKQVLEVELSKEVSDTYKLILELEKTEEEISGFYEVGEITTKDAERQTGHIVIVMRENLKVQPTEKSGISQIDADQLPEELKRSIKDEISLAYRYLKLPISLTLNIKKVKPEVNVRNNIFFQVDEELMKLYTLLDYDIQKAGIFSFQLELPKGFSLIDVVGDNLETWAITKKDDLQILEVQLKGKALGRYELLVSMEKPVKGIKDILEGIEVPKMKVLNIKKEIGYIGVGTVSNIRLRTDVRKNLSEIDIGDLVTPPKGIEIPPALAYKCIEQPYQLKLAAEEVEPRVTSEVFTFLSVGEGLLLINSAIAYEILYAGIKEFAIAFPEDVQAVDITGKNIKSKEESIQEREVDGKKIKEKIWKVSLHSKTKGTYPLYCSYQKLMKDISAKVDLPRLQVLDVKRETGYYCLGPRTNVEIRPDVVTGCTQIDVKELPEDKTEGIDIPLILAFKYVRHPYEISVDVKRHRDVAVLVAAAESAQITSVLTREGQTVVDALYSIKNKQKQYLDILLPRDANIWSTFVNNKAVKPGKTKEGHILVPLEKLEEEERTFPVEIIYETKRSNLKLFGKVKMTQPRLDIPITNVTWRIYLPDELRYFGFAGNLKMAKEVAPREALLMRRKEAALKREALMEERVWDKETEELREYGIRKPDKMRIRAPVPKLITRGKKAMRDLDFISNIQSQVQNYQRQLEAQQAGGQVSKGRQVGVLPIRLTIPTGGKLYTFNKLFSSEELLNMNAFYSQGPLKFIWMLIIIAAVLLVIALISQRALSAKKA